MTETLRQKLLSAEVCCKDCGQKYGKYSVGVSSTWEAQCDVCGETKGCTEVRDWGYLTKGIQELKGAETKPFSELTQDFTPERKARIKEQSKEVAAYMASVGPIMTDPELEDALAGTLSTYYKENPMTFDEMDYKGEYLRIATVMAGVYPECEVTTLDMVKLLVHENDTLRMALKMPTRKMVLRQINAEEGND